MCWSKVELLDTQQQTRDLEHSRSRAQTTPSPTLSSPSYPLTTSKAQGRERMGKRDDGEGQFLCKKET